MREAIGPDVPGITDHHIQEALWHYYYDVGKSVAYLLNFRTKEEEKEGKKKKENKKGGWEFRIHDCGDSEEDSFCEERGFGGGFML